MWRWGVMTDSLYTAGKRLKEIRLKSKISLREFAKRINFSPSYVSYIENGEKRGSVDFFQKCSEVLGISIGDLFDDKKVPVSEELKKEGVEWIILGKELEKDGISMEDVKKWVDEYKKTL
jgi:XRE family transcriptional regulator, master regulator for biofilm formation